MSRTQIAQWVKKAVWSQPVSDPHTHTCPPVFGASPKPEGLLLWGVDELVTYHYLIAEVFRAVPATKLPYEKYWAMSKTEQADHIWKHLFVERTPIGEACRGVLTALERLGLDPNEKSLTKYRKWFAK
ncbi:MAG TPA: glucuronate isomerase, partial [Candidatus Methylomirabilis sp.]